MGQTQSIASGSEPIRDTSPVAIGKEIAAQLGMQANLLDASAFGDAKHHEAAQLDASIEKADGFAQVSHQ